jgi:hypothetical protein
MGNIIENINYNNFICDNYYCNSVSLKPEWFSESSWKITYDTTDKPYFIDKGTLKIKSNNSLLNIQKFKLILSKKLLIEDLKNVSIPINFSYNLEEINIFIIFSNKILTLDNIIDIDKSDNIFYIKLNIKNNKLNINRSFDNKNIIKKIKPKKINSFIIELEHKDNIILINESLFIKSKKKYEGKYLKFIPYEINSDSIQALFLSFFIRSKNEFKNNFDFLELNFE